MDRWDNEESGKSKRSLGSKKSLLLLIGIMISMWIMLGFMTYYSSAPNCNYIEQLIDSDDFYNMSTEYQQKYLEMQHDCHRDSIVVR